MPTMQEIFFERQVAAYERLIEKIVAFDVVEVDEAKTVTREMLDVFIGILPEFARGSMFFDNKTTEIFKQRILVPFLNDDFDMSPSNELWYDNVRHRLMEEVVVSIRDFFKSKFPDLYE